MNYSPSLEEMELDRLVGLSYMVGYHFQQKGLRPTHISMCEKRLNATFGEGKVPKYIWGMTVVVSEEFGDAIAVMNCRKEKNV